MDDFSPRRLSTSSLSDDPDFMDRVVRSRDNSEYDTSSPDEPDGVEAMSRPRLQEGTRNQPFKPVDMTRRAAVTGPVALSNSSGIAPSTSASRADRDDARAVSPHGNRRSGTRRKALGTRRQSRDFAASGALARETGTGMPSGRAPTSTSSSQGAAYPRMQARGTRHSLWPKGSGVSSGSELDVAQGSESDGSTLDYMNAGTPRYPFPLPPIASSGLSASMDEAAAANTQAAPVSGEALFTGNLPQNSLERLIMSVESDDYDTVKSLIEGGLTNPHIPRPLDLRTPLMMSIAKGTSSTDGGTDGSTELPTNDKRFLAREKIAKLLIRHARPDQLQARDADGNTALMLAVLHGRDRVLKHLLRHTKPEQLRWRNRFGQNALPMGLDNGRILATRYLLAAGADVPNSRGHTALLAAIAAENIVRVRVLIKAGTMINQSGPKRETPLTMAIRKNDAEMVALLLHAGAYADETNPDLDVPLIVAARFGNMGIVSALLEHGASVERVNHAGIGPLHIAAKHGYSDVIALLIDEGADVNARDHYGLTPMHAAAAMGHVEAMRLLHVHGASLESADRHGYTPLHWAAQFGATDCCRFLIAQGADIAGRSKDGKSALDKAKMAGYTETVELLTQAQMRDEDNQNKVAHACVLF